MSVDALSQPIESREYLGWGFGLALIKYFSEAYFLFAMTGQVYTPWAFVLPFISLKSQYFMAAPPWVGGIVLAWSLPFVFIGLWLTIRRCLDVNASPWTAFWMLCPLVNIPFLLVLGLMPSAQRRPGDELDMLAVQDAAVHASPAAAKESTIEALRAVFLGLLFGSSSLIFGVYCLGQYGQSLFFLTPIMMSAITAHQFQSRARGGLAMSFALTMFCVTCGLGLMLLLALEGLLCVMMASPLVYGGGLIGWLLGFAIASAEAARNRTLVPAIVLMPVLALLEWALASPPQIEVVSSVEVAASCQEVWPRVIAFSPITQPPTGWLAMGIAYPKSARIVGSGVGATRYCEFSTGAFVEPITVWDQPNRLAFNVVDQPSPMTELSPYRHIHPPHLDGYLASKRGEFRLIELSDGRMRLEGHTWYSVNMYPQAYWQWWSDKLIHDIHMRVLNHIKTEVESARLQVR